MWHGLASRRRAIFVWGHSMAVTANKGYELQVTGSNSGTWGTTLNDSVISVIDSNLGDIVTKTLTSSNIVLSATEARAAILRLTGTLSANVQVTTSAKGFLHVENATTGNYSVTVTNGVGAVVIPPQGVTRQVIIDGTNGVRAVGLPPPGTMFDYAGTAASFPPWLAGEYLLAYGQAVSRSTYANLFSAIGTTFGSGDGSTTFNLPDTRGRATFGVDNMGGSAASRVTSASGISGTTLGATGGAQTHTLATSEMPAHNHTATVSTDGAHTHTYLMTGSGAAGTGSGGDANGKTSQPTSSNGAHTHTVTIANTGDGGAHNNMPPAIIVNKMIKI